jgi:heme/copper-type cytochrome/quinol oxidase subunit 3
MECGETMIIALSIYILTVVVLWAGILQVYKLRKTSHMRGFTLGDLLIVSLLAVVPVINTLMLLGSICANMKDRFISSKFFNKKLQDL